MKNEIQKLITQEKHNAPYTDTELAARLAVSREYVTILRKELQISDSRERKQSYIAAEIQQIFQTKANIDVKGLKEELEAKNFRLSDYLLNKYWQSFEENRIKAEIMDTGGPPKVRSILKQEQAFQNLIGTRGSLYAQIQQAKAAILYPPHGLHCLILGETGVGKSELAEAMYRFAIESGSLPREAPFNVFNCADYAENPQLLITQLFGCMKGAYTGAACERKGLIEQADGGILFLDEVHRLSSEGQEMLFQLIDKGNFRRLGEADAVRKANVQLIAATTENIETSLLGTFKRRIPMLISMPSLTERPLTERLQLIEKFFGNESLRMNAILQVSLESVKAYLLYDCPGNIGQLKSDIQVACAKSFLDFVTHKTSGVYISIQNVGLHVKKGLLRIAGRRKEIDQLVWKDLKFEPQNDSLAAGLQEDDIYSLPKEFYGYIENLYDCYEKDGIPAEEIARLVGAEIEEKLQKIITHSQRRMAPLSLDEVAKVIGHDVVHLSQEIQQIAEQELGPFDLSLVYCLAVHLSAAFTRLGQGKKIINPNLKDIQKRFSREYATAGKIARLIEARYHIDLPMDEIGYIALYLHKPKVEDEGKVGVIIAAHGGVGHALLDIASKLLNVNHGKSFDMGFERDPQEDFEDLLKIICEADEGKGVLLLVDMGSLLTFGEIAQARTGIRIETINRVDTMMVIEALRRSILPETTLDDLVDAIENLGETFPKNCVDRRMDALKPRAIVTACFTGEGAAVYCSQRLKKLFGTKLRDISLLHIGMIGKNDINHKIYEIMRKYEIIAVVGSVDPQLDRIPYISLKDLMDETGVSKLERLLQNPAAGEVFVESEKPVVPETVRQMECMIFDRICDKQQIIHEMCSYLTEKGYVAPGYEKAVWAREEMGSFLINRKVALPHADSSYVRSSVVLFAKAAKPVAWSGKESTNLICMLGLDINGKDSVRYLYDRFLEEETLARLESAKTENELREALISYGYCGNGCTHSPGFGGE